MSVYEIVFSPTGGTEKVAHIVGGRWSKDATKGAFGVPRRR